MRIQGLVDLAAFLGSAQHVCQALHPFRLRFLDHCADALVAQALGVDFCHQAGVADGGVTLGESTGDG